MMTSSNGNICRVTGPLWWKSAVDSPHKGQWLGALMFCASTTVQQTNAMTVMTPLRPLWHHRYEFKNVWLFDSDECNFIVFDLDYYYNTMFTSISHDSLTWLLIGWRLCMLPGNHKTHLMFLWTQGIFIVIETPLPSSQFTCHSVWSVIYYILQLYQSRALIISKCAPYGSVLGTDVV